MNTIDFTKPGGFPFTQDTLDFMQSEYVRMLNGIGAAWAATQGVQYVIVSGCVDTGGVISAGVCAVNGELIYCPGGSGENVRIVETAQNATFENGSVFPVYVTRMLLFQEGDGQIPWSEFKRIPQMATFAQGQKADSALQSKATQPIEVNSTSAGGVARVCHYRINEIGCLEIKGQVAVRSPLMTLVEGYRPLSNARLLTSQNDAVVEININAATGAVTTNVLSGSISLNAAYLFNNIIPL